MRNLVVRLLINALGLVAAASLIEGIHLAPWFVDVMVVAVVFGLVNSLIRPIVVLLSFPFLILSLGLLTFVINAGMLLLTSHFTERLAVDGFIPALLGSLVISVVGVVAGMIFGEDD